MALDTGRVNALTDYWSMLRAQTHDATGAQITPEFSEALEEDYRKFRAWSATAADMSMFSVGVNLANAWGDKLGVHRFEQGLSAAKASTKATVLKAAFVGGALTLVVYTLLRSMR